LRDDDDNNNNNNNKMNLFLKIFACWLKCLLARSKYWTSTRRQSRQAPKEEAQWSYHSSSQPLFLPPSPLPRRDTFLSLLLISRSYRSVRHSSISMFTLINRVRRPTALSNENTNSYCLPNELLTRCQQQYD